MAEGGDDDDHELDTVCKSRQTELSRAKEMGRTHALATDDIREPTEEQLTDEVTDGRRDLDTEVLVRAEFLAFTVDVAEHRRGDVDGEDVISMSGVRGVRITRTGGAVKMSLTHL